MGNGAGPLAAVLVDTLRSLRSLRFSSGSRTGTRRESLSKDRLPLSGCLQGWQRNRDWSWDVRSGNSAGGERDTDALGHWEPSWLGVGRGEDGGGLPGGCGRDGRGLAGLTFGAVVGSLS